MQAHQTWAVLIKLPSIHPWDLLTPIIRLTPLPSSISSYFSQQPPPPSAHHPVPSSDQGCPFAVLKAPEACTISGCWWRLLHSLLLELHQECVSSSIDIKSLLFSQQQWKVHSKFKIKFHDPERIKKTWPNKIFSQKPLNTGFKNVHADTWYFPVFREPNIIQCSKDEQDS